LLPFISNYFENRTMVVKWHNQIIFQNRIIYQDHMPKYISNPRLNESFLICSFVFVSANHSNQDLYLFLSFYISFARYKLEK